MIGDNKILTARYRWSRTVSFPAECQISDDCVGSTQRGSRYLSERESASLPGYDERSSAECVCDCNRKSCGVTVDVDAVAVYYRRDVDVKTSRGVEVRRYRGGAGRTRDLFWRSFFVVSPVPCVRTFTR